jgi:Flp pilus assembly protein TadD
VALYDAALARNPLDADLAAARARAAARKPAPPLPTIKQGAARAIIAAAVGAVTERQSQIAQAYLQLALRLDPDREEALLLLGDVLAGADDPEAARAAYARIPVGSSSYQAARTKLAWTYQQAGDSETAIRMASEQLKASPGDRLAASTLADMLRANERYAESAAVLDTVIGKGGVSESDWRLLYMRGVALEQSGRSVDAERDLTAALALRPDEPELLNYLGYLWIDRGVRLDEAQRMIEKALATNPRSGAMIDSLAWAYYRKGDYKTAVEKLEQAVELEPADPDINDHLGDAYWRVGRRVEAEFQWRRVLTLEPDRRRKAEVEAKLANGLGASGPAQRPAVAGR